MTVEELIVKLLDCHPQATVMQGDGEYFKILPEIEQRNVYGSREPKAFYPDAEDGHDEPVLAVILNTDL